MSSKTVNQEIQDYLDEKQLELENNLKGHIASIVEDYSSRYSSEINKLRKSAKFVDTFSGFELMKIIRGGGQVIPVDQFEVKYPRPHIRFEVDGIDILYPNGSPSLKQGRYKLTVIIKKLEEPSGG
jgi:hypothetical protein